METATAFDALTRRFLLDYPAEAAARAQQYPPEDVAEILSDQPVHVVIRVWRHLTPHYSDRLLPLLADPALAALLVEMDAPNCAQVIGRLSDEDRERCLAVIGEHYAAQLRSLMTYPVDTAGRVMDPRVQVFRGDQTAEQALAELRRAKARAVRQVFLVDGDGRLERVVDIQDLALGDDRETLESLSRPPRATVSPFDPKEEVAEKLTRFNLDLLPVVDVNGRLLGAIRHSVLLQTLQDDSLADLQAMVGVSREERALSPALFAVRKRLPWMEINLATAFLAAAVVGLFEETIAQFTALAVLLPVVAGQSGNAGAQAQAVTMRGLALREITVRNWFRILFKEVNVGLLNGLAIALTTAVGVWVWSQSWGLALVIAISMVISMVAAGDAGGLIPMILTRLGQDPAQSSSIILTTVTDVAGFMSFLGIATLLSTLL